MTNQIVSSKQASIQWYLDRGFILFPLNGKHPPKDFHWREAKYDPFFEATNNFGVQLQADDLVIDVDPRNFDPEDNPYQRLCIDTNLHLVESFTVKTGSGGTHVYLKKPPNIKIRKKIKEYKGIDFLSEGCYVVGVGSIHPDTHEQYRIIKHDRQAEAPGSVLSLITKTDTPSTKGTGSYDDNDQAVERFEQYLRDTEPAVEGTGGDATTFAVCARGRDFGLSPDCVYDRVLKLYNPRCQPPWQDDQLKIKVDNAYKYSKGSVGSSAPAVAFEVWTEEKIEENNKEINKYLQRRGGVIKANLNNTAILFNENFPVPTLHHLLGFNEFTNNIEFLRAAPWHKRGHPVKSWSDAEAVLCKYFMSNMWKFEPNTNLVHEAALKASQDHRFHPVRDYLEGLQWDGHERCANWLHDIMGSYDTLYGRAIGIKFLVAAVKRIFEPGCKFDYILTLEGKQGTFKSTVFEILATKKEWYADPHMDITHKDSVPMLFGKWIVEMPEMQTHYRAETTAMKGFLSRSVDRARLSYNRVMGDYPRQCVFGGTINPEHDKDIGWLKDTTGNRRYWPILVGCEHEPKLAALRKIVDQLWAEAYQKYLAGVPVYLDDRAIEKEAQDEQAKRLSVDPWQEPIETYLYAPQCVSDHVFTGDRIFRECIGGNLDKYGPREMGRISHVMETLGWTKGVYWNKAEQKPVRGYRRPEIL